MGVFGVFLFFLINCFLGLHVFYQHHQTCAADMFSALLVFVLCALPLLTISSIMLALFELVIIL